METFFNKANDKFKNKFTYLKDAYQSNKKPMTIICPIHKEFSQTPQSHIKSIHGCPKCAKENRKGRITKEVFIQKANKVHNNKYDYSKAIFINRTTHLIVICPIHGNFSTTPDNHLNINKYGCPNCGKDKRAAKQRLTTEEYINQTNKIHNNKYDYSKTIYTGAHNKIIVICPEHRDWTPTASNHKNNKSGCPQCAFINKTISKYENFVEQYLKEHNIQHTREQSFIDLINPKTKMMLRVDFWLSKLDIIIEYDGEHHFKPVRYGKSDPQKLLEYTQFKDEIKNQYCKNNNITLIRIPYIQNTQKRIYKYLDNYLDF